MVLNQIHSLWVFATTLLFASVLLLPCLCATAMAQESDQPAEDCCPSGQSPMEDGEDRHSEDCCGGCASACGDTDNTSAIPSGGAIVSTAEIGEDIDGPGLWWTPDIVAALWLVDRFALLEEQRLDALSFIPSEIRPDRSDTYLQHATFLI